MSLGELRLIPVDQIRHRPDARRRTDDALAALAESIDKIGLINPIRIRRVVDANDHVNWDGGYEVVAGSHRLQAVESLGWRDVSCLVVTDDDLHAELAMIDENLCRAELSPADRAVQTRRREALYLALHPETGHGGDRKSDQVANLATRSFAKETAAATGKSERTVRLDAERGEKVCDEAIALILNTKLNTGAYLDRLKRVPADQQVTQVKRDLAQPKPAATERQQSGIAARIEPKLGPTYEDLRAAILLLADLTPADFTRLCPPNKRAAMNQKLTHLIGVFEQVKEGASS